MSRKAKLLHKLMSGRSDANFAFDDLCWLLERLGFTARPGGGSHLVYQRDEIFINLQRPGVQAKAYQIRQVREKLQ